MSSFIQKLEASVRVANSLLCIGLDPHLADLEGLVEQTAHQTIPVTRLAIAAQQFCQRIIEQTAEVAAAFKPNIAFFEALGPKGMVALQEVIAAIPARIPVILDAKRGDIATTAEAYARAAFQVLEADAITLNPYLGRDSLDPFIADPAKGVFLLCKTSNPGSADLQDLTVSSLSGAPPLTVYETVARLANDWNTGGNIGLVVGATHPDAMRRVREIAPNLWFLAPGVGSQGGELRAALETGLRADGTGLLVNVSRSVARAASPLQAATRLRDEINEIRQEISSRPHPAVLPRENHLSGSQAALADALLSLGCVKFGRFTLKSGKLSPIYIDLRQLVSQPSVLAQVAAAFLPILRGLVFDRLAALPYAALPIATAISLQSGWAMLYPRKEVKEYGTKAEIEGLFNPGETAVVIDDLATTGGSKFEAIDKLKSAGLRVRDIVVLIDRQSGATEALANSGYFLHSVFSLTQLVDHWEQIGAVPSNYANAVRKFLQQEAHSE